MPSVTDQLDEVQTAAGDATWLPKLTVEQYHAMLDAGIFQSGDPWELLDGMIVRLNKSGRGERIEWTSPPHSFVTGRLRDLSRELEPHGCHMRTEQPIDLPPHSSPEPDGVIVVGDDLRYLTRRPTAAETLCIIEVAESSLAMDLGLKLRLYAAANIATYVVLDLATRTATVLTDPDPAESAYAARQTLSVDDRLALPTATGEPVTVPVADLLPPAP